MPTTDFWSQSVPRVELDQRSRAARLRLERGDLALAGGSTRSMLTKERYRLKSEEAASAIRRSHPDS